MIEAGFAAIGGLALLYFFFRHSERDAVTLLTIWLALLWLMSARWVFAPLGAVGMPAIVFGVGLMLIWVWARLVPRPSLLADGFQPVRLGFGAYASLVLASYAVAQLRPLTELETTSSARALITLASMGGVALLAADGIRDRIRLEKLLKRLVAVATIVGLVGWLQFFVGVDLSPNMRLPGLSQHAPMMGLRDRSLFEQAYGTTLHPIEFSVVMAVVLPLALHFALFEVQRWKRAGWWVAVTVLAVGCLLSVARSGVVAIGIAMPVLALGWGWRWRFNGAVYGLGFVAVMWALVPGLIGTIRGLFQGMDHDPSIQGRRERVPMVIEQLQENGFLGLGPGTFTPEEYFLLDNAYYGVLLELGWPGVFVVIAMLGSGIGAALVAKRYQDPETRHLSQALIAGIAVMPVVMSTFDALSFQTNAGTTYLLLGAAGALWRITLPDRASAAPPAQERSDKSGHAPSLPEGGDTQRE
ncbi:O-antigen ligase domain-containing protein [Egibacter rhizosphaerae]|uniref:O-antigen ligase domain-containing protein n=1 Tax=Egibacter rhizosphaerae TaxID=1670831 RepID=A0A411YGB7_9ACTN|nr:O-antigen ligase family protein [Egibacter rhizosphaerae]QBI20280.1 O-antigen ligase domain-containing protein [Egibacter rhizosphaerae]